MAAHGLAGMERKSSGVPHVHKPSRILKTTKNYCNKVWWLPLKWKSLLRMRMEVTRNKSLTWDRQTGRPTFCPMGELYSVAIMNTNVDFRSTCTQSTLMGQVSRKS